jgi:hypothetical protein
MTETTTTTPEGRSFERPVGRPAKVKAWKIYVRGWGKGPEAVTMATTRGRAIARSLASAQDVGYGLKWGDFRAVRSPEHDDMFIKHGLFSWSFDHAQAVLCADQSANTGNERPGGSAR